MNDEPTKVYLHNTIDLTVDQGGMGVVYVAMQDGLQGQRSVFDCD